MRNFTILFDNGGGATLMTRGYCHCYDDGKQLGRDVLSLLTGSNPSDWEGNEPECRRDKHQTDTSETTASILAVLHGEARLELPSGATHRAFWAELSPSEHTAAEAREEL